MCHASHSAFPQTEAIQSGISQPIIVNTNGKKVENGHRKNGRFQYGGRFSGQGIPVVTARFRLASRKLSGAYASLSRLRGATFLG